MSYNTQKIDNAIIIGWDSPSGYKQKAILTEGKKDDEIITECETFLNEIKLEAAERSVERSIDQIKNHLNQEA